MENYGKLWKIMKKGREKMEKSEKDKKGKVVISNEEFAWSTWHLLTLKIAKFIHHADKNGKTPKNQKRKDQ